MKYRIYDKLSQVYYGLFDGDSKDAAIDAFRQSMGYESSEAYAIEHVKMQGLGIEYVIPIQRMLDSRLLVEEAPKETIQ